MRTLVILAVVGMCSAVPFIQDTPAVAAEKARFFQAYRAAQASATPQHHNYVPHQAYNPTPYQAKWTGPVAATVPAGVNGAVIPVGNTADVTAARQAFFGAYQAQLAATVGAAPARTQWNAAPAPQWNAAPAPQWNAAPAPQWNAHSGQYQAKWTGPVAATIPAGLPGSASQVADTPEVMAAKSAFFQTYQRQAAAAAAPAPVWG